MGEHPLGHLVTAIVEAWRAEAVALRRRGLVTYADLIASLADDLADTTDQWLVEPLTLNEAAEWSGHAYSTLETRVRTGSLPNVGRKGRPRVLRRHLPFRAPAGPRLTVSVEDANDLDQLLRGLGS